MGAEAHGAWEVLSKARLNLVIIVVLKRFACFESLFICRS